MPSYTYQNYSIELDNHESFITIKVINNINNYFYSKNITQNDFSTYGMNNYNLFIQNCLSNKSGYSIEFNECDEKIHIVMKCDKKYFKLNDIVTLNIQF